MVKNGYCGNDGFIFAWDLGINFLCIPNWVIDGFLKFFCFNFGLKGIIEKFVGCFLAYLFLRVFLLKRCRKCVCDSIKIELLPYFNN